MFICFRKFLITGNTTSKKGLHLKPYLGWTKDILLVVDSLLVRMFCLEERIFFTQLHFLFNVAHQMRLVVQREGVLDLLKVILC